MLQDKVALVTGAGRGFGWGIARALARAGAKVCITDINKDELARAEGDIKADSRDAMALALDVSDASAFEHVVQRLVERWGRVDILVHNAIYMPLQPFEETTPDSWWRQLHVGLGGLYNGTRAVWEAMKAQGGGHMVGIASGSSLRGYADEVAYCTIKHGQEGFVKALAIEALPHNIAVNTMGPGKPIKPTRMTWAELEGVPAEEKEKWADPVELGKAFVWLASQPPSRFTGLRFDAGSIVDTIAAEGDDFVFAPHKGTMYVDDFTERQNWIAHYTSQA